MIRIHFEFDSNPITKGSSETQTRRQNGSQQRRPSRHPLIPIVHNVTVSFPRPQARGEGGATLHANDIVFGTPVTVA
jgi:hypothetical protein